VIDADHIAELSQVSVRHGEKRALDGVSLVLRSGEITAVLGANGSGKSTLLKLLAGRVVPASGMVRYSPRLGQSDHERAHSLGYAAQRPELDPEMTAREHLQLFAALCRLPKDQRPGRIERVSEQLGLAGFLDQRVEQCSGGMRQRLHLALSMLHTPLLWLLDEPFQGLDPEAQSGLWRALAEHRAANGTALLVSHDLARTAELADRVLFLEGGRLVAHDAPESLARVHGSLEAAYEALTGRRVRELSADTPRKGRGPRA
jgi:ABC-type multidrug transport system ATPase subunit